MPSISVIIPVYNHADEALACLKSLSMQTEKDFDVIMVDDGSTDGLMDRVPSYHATFPFHFMRFRENRGAPVARNEGFRRSDGRFVIFLDADAQLEPDALRIMRETLERHPEAAFAYPSFRFGWKSFRGRPFDPEYLRERNYIHTSALIRREAFPGFDETLKKFQDWDLWLTLAERGEKGVWIRKPLFRLTTRREGYSRWLPKIMFQIPWDVFGWAPPEVRKYRAAEDIVQRKHGIVTEESRSRALAERRRVFHWFLAIVGFEIISGAVIFVPIANAIATVAIGIAILVLTVRKPSWALALLATEFLIGSKGALYKFGGDGNNNGGISVRIVMLAAFLLGWIILAFLRKQIHDWRPLIAGRKIYLALAAAIIYAFLSGWFHGNRQYLLADANAWAMWLVLLPVLDLVSRYKDDVRRDARAAVIAALLWLPIKTLLLFYFFSHGFPSVATQVYLWVRRSGVGEVTRLALNAYRIFFQSHVYAVFVATTVFVWFAYRDRRPGWLRGLLVITLAELLISLSRSFWLGTFAGLMTAVLLARRGLQGWPVAALKRLTLAGGAALLLVAGILAVPIPPVDTTSLFGLLGTRADLGEAAAVSRWQLFTVLKDKIAASPILGHGFGATVTYESKDPRIVAETGGIYTTYAFEWGWLEHWVKFGILGIPLMLAILWSLAHRLWKSALPEWSRVAAVSSLVALAVIHTFTPYLNHPLGFFMLMAGEGLLILLEHNKKTS